MFAIYVDGLRVLWQYREFQVVFELFRYSLLVVAGIVAIVFILHISFLLSRNSLLYRRRSPRHGWNKQFFPAAGALFTGLIVLFWLSGLWIASAS